MCGSSLPLHLCPPECDVLQAARQECGGERAQARDQDGSASRPSALVPHLCPPERDIPQAPCQECGGERSQARHQDGSASRPRALVPPAEVDADEVGQPGQKAGGQRSYDDATSSGGQYSQCNSSSGGQY